MKVLITGGSGFLGINLIRYLLKKEITDIRVLDVEDFDYPDAKDKISFVKGDVRDRNAVSQCVPEHGVIIHTAAALPLYSREDILTTEVDGIRIILEEAMKKSVDRVIHISSTAVYGITDDHPIYETARLKGVGPYGKAKILAEEICREYRQKGLCVTILRPKSFVGPERLGVFAILYDWAWEGRNFPVIGKGNNRYQLLDVEDLCLSIWLCMTKDKAIVNDTFNIAAKEFQTMREDFQAVLDIAGHDGKIIGIPETPAIMALKLLSCMRLSPLYPWIYETASRDSYVSIEKAESILEFAPIYSNKDALIRNFIWYRDNRDRIKRLSGITHRTAWNQGILKVVKRLF
ncbi:MAG: NAD-dependent epimerase/dehydratase family protein [Syntrophales bacterium]|nr:NAD-dependent epimerase/dehydratase family protein [Syntrophales bacterium]